MISTAVISGMIQAIRSTASTPICSSTSPRPMTDAQIQVLFEDWWKESFPMTPVNKQTAAMYVAFASHALALNALMQEYERPSATND